MKQIIEGVQRFRTQIFPEKRGLFKALASGQSPSALMISCADSRVDMGMVTQCGPGHLFMFRNAGNIVPPFGRALGAACATIEYAMVALQIPNIIVCGHSDCGAMKGVLAQGVAETMPTVAQWLKYADVSRQIVLVEGDPDPQARVDRLIRLNVLSQLDHLKTHPSVAVRIARGEVKLHGWVYDIEHGSVDAYDPASGTFMPLDQIAEAHATTWLNLSQAEAGV
ncbi:MAG TPA: carbonic anhydrase [Polyangiales bacterium]|nr:carbonic anhydrase [Polyangiales bacterium]